MPKDRDLRQHLIKLLSGRDAHADFDQTIHEFPIELRGKTPKGAQHSPWEELEHLRIAQWDILDFSTNPEYKEKSGQRIIGLPLQLLPMRRPGTKASRIFWPIGMRWLS